MYPCSQVVSQLIEFSSLYILQSASKDSLSRDGGDIIGDGDLLCSGYLL
jgi:hypothetical protein